MSVPGGVPAAAGETGSQDRRRWLVLAIIGTAQLMIVLDITIMNIALPSAQHDLHFSNVDRQWVVTAYSLAFGSLLLFFGRVADLVGRKVTFLIGLAGFAVASAVGGASVSFAMLVTARAAQGAFAAVLAPSALSLLTTTFSDPKERGKAFGVFGAIAAGGSAVGLLLGGVLTEYLSWRWCLYVNLFFAAFAFIGGSMLLRRQPALAGARLDVPGVLTVSGGMFCLTYGFSNAATHSWSAPSTLGFLAAGVVLLAIFAAWQARAPYPLLPPRVVIDRNRGGAYLSILIVGAGMFGIFLFLTYYLQVTLRYTPVTTGFAFLPMAACIGVAANVSTIVLLPRLGPKPIIPLGLLLAAGGMVWLTNIGPNSSYAADILPPLLVAGLGFGLLFSAAINTGTYGVAPSDAGVASASVNTGQQLGGSIGTALLNTIAASATAHYLAANASPRTLVRGHPTPQLVQLSLVHGYVTAFWWSAGIFAAGAVICGALLRPGPLFPRAAAGAGAPGIVAAPAEARAQSAGTTASAQSPQAPESAEAAERFPD
ncbi:MAG: MFS transporter [Streptosporangiaceae bacterium]|nr:MFS transporter [Streptosporangiaceae bacterium]MBV9858350.1 MFS transporter [Streptosporangiaceae bacterium]